MYLSEAPASFKKNKSCPSNVLAFLGQNHTMKR